MKETDNYSDVDDLYRIADGKLIPVDIRTENIKRTQQEEMYGRLRW